MPGDHILDGALAHALSFLGLALATGPGTLRLATGAGPDPADARMVLAGGVAVGAASALHLLQGATTMAGSLAPAAAWGVLTGSEWGRSLALHGAAAAATVALGLGAARGTAARPGGMVVAGMVAAGLAVLGLAALGHGVVRGAISPLFLAHAAHGGAALIWVGGLLALSVRLPRGAALGVRPLRAFSRLAAGSVAATLPPGLAAAAVHLGGVGGVASPWGALLAVKVACVAAGLGLAWGHRRRRLPRLKGAPGDPEAWRALDRAVAIEVGLVLTAVLLAGLMSQWETP